jgi:CBS domain-containing protein
MIARLAAVIIFLSVAESSMRRLSDIICRKQPFCLPPSASVHDASRQMRERHIGAVLVTGEDGKLLGIFTGRDAIGRVLAENKNAKKTTLGDVMTTNLTTMAPNMTAIDALRLMWDGGFRHIPVVEHGNIIGIVARGDFHAAEDERIEEERDLWQHMR